MPLSLSNSPHHFLGLPWQFLVLGLILCLLASALGFKRVEYFVSLGYAASVATQAITFLILYRDTIKGLALLQCALILAYGLRLGIFLSVRDPQSVLPEAASTKHGPRHQSKCPNQVCNLARSLVLYVLLFLPALLTMSAQAGGMS